MPRSRSTNRGRGRYGSNRGRPRKTPARKAKRKTASEDNSEAQEIYSSTSETSPFKGYQSPLLEDDENVKEVKLFDDVSDDDKNSVFEKLLDPPLRSNFLNKNIRTYSNKKKLKPQDHLLEFQDSKNREKIIEWLNDNRNIFDKLTQTQCDNNQENEVPLTLDMPSVSQLNSAKMNRSHSKTVRKTCRSPYKLRARSLDIHITKNGRKGRNKRHSLAGDTPSMENYHIEEVVTDDETPVPAEKNAKLLIDLMEDEYLDTLEKEILPNSKKLDEKTHQNNDGWERIKDITKTINIIKKQPKQLNITLQSSQNKKDEDLLHNRTCNLEELENYFIEKMAAILNNKEFSSPTSTQQTVKFDISPVESVLKTANNLVDILNKFIKKQNNLRELQPVMSEIKKMLTIFNTKNKYTSETANQTIVLQNFDKQIQTSVEVVNSEIQTEDLYHCNNCANNNNNIIKFKSVGVCDIIVQTEVEKNSVGVQTETISNNNLQDSAKPTLISGSTTPSDIFLINQVERLLCDNENNDNNSRQAEIKKTMTPSTSIILNHTLDNVCFDTEEALQQEVEKVKEKSVKDTKDTTYEHKVISVESDLVCSVEVENHSKGMKRVLHSPVNDAQESRTKRPCTKFIKDDLTVAFDSCATVEENARNDVLPLSEESDDDKFDEHLDRVMRKYNQSMNNDALNESVSIIDKTQKDIEDLEEKIRNATKPTRLAIPNNNSEASNDSDVIFIEAEMNLSKLEKDLDYFNPHSSDVNAEKTPKKSRKKLFDSQENKRKESCKFSESLFNNTHEEAVADDMANRTITKDNVDMIMKDTNPDSDVEVDDEVEKIMSTAVPKINVLQNVIVKNAEDESTRAKEQINENVDDIVLSGIDVVECTPQKHVPSFAEHRSHSFLDITLPPPIEFQDVEMTEENGPENNTTPKSVPAKKPSPPRRPLAVVNKITSTPISQRAESERITLSPVSRIPGPIEIVQQSKFSPLTIIKTTQSQRNVRLSGTPKQKSILNYVRPSQESQENIVTPTTPKNRPCVSCSRISRDQVISISGLSSKKLISYSSTFSKKVTHMIVSVNNQNRIKDHTIKSVSAIAAGIWVLSFGWVQECLAKNTLVPEEPYEVLDVSGIPGPRKSRLTRSANPLLKGYKIHVSPPFLSTSMQDIENIVQMLGGKVVPSPGDLLDKDGYICLIITEGKATQDCDSEKFETWLEALRVVTVDLEWLSRSVGQYQLQSLLPFTLCSDDLIDTLGYPPELLTNVPASFMQSTSSI